MVGLLQPAFLNLLVASLQTCIKTVKVRVPPRPASSPILFSSCFPLCRLIYPNSNTIYILLPPKLLSETILSSRPTCPACYMTQDNKSKHNHQHSLQTHRLLSEPHPNNGTAALSGTQTANPGLILGHQAQLTINPIESSKKSLQGLKSPALTSLLPTSSTLV